MVPTYFDNSHLLFIRVNLYPLVTGTAAPFFFNKLNIQQQLIDAGFDLSRLIRRLILSHQKTAPKF